MGGGAPLAFLNKKTWHPSNLRNMEEVWKREQQAAAEAKKLEEIRKQMDEERKRQDLMQVAVAAGKVQCAERLDWMYAGSLAAKEDAAKKQEEQLLGQRPTNLLDVKAEEKSRAEVAARLPSFYTDSTPQTQNESWQRLNNDPLFAIRRQQQEALKTIRQNPVKMEQIIKEVQALKKDQDSKSKKRKGKDKEKKAKKKHKHGHKEEEEDASPASDDVHHGLRHGRQGQHPHASHAHPPSGPPAFPPPPQLPPSQPSSRRGDAEYKGLGSSRGDAGYNGLGGSSGGGEYRGLGSSRAGADQMELGTSRGEMEYRGLGNQHRVRDGEREAYRGENGRYKENGRGRHVQGILEEEDDAEDYEHRGGKAHHRQDSTHYRHGSEREYHRQEEFKYRGDRKENGRERQEHEQGDRGREGREREGRARKEGREADGRSGHRQGRERDGRERSSRDMDEGGQRHGQVREERDGEVRETEGRETRRKRVRGDDGDQQHQRSLSPVCKPSEPAHLEPAKQGGKPDSGALAPGYGLSVSKRTSGLVDAEQQEKRAAETRERLQEAAAKAEEEERVKRLARVQRKEYKTGKLSEEEKARRLAEMLSNAEQHDEQRMRRLHNAGKEDREAEANRLPVLGAERQGAFMAAATRDVYASMDHSSIETRISSRKHYNQR